MAEVTPLIYPISVAVVVAGEIKPEPSDTKALLAVVAASFVKAIAALAFISAFTITPVQIDVTIDVLPEPVISHESVMD